MKTETKPYRDLPSVDELLRSDGIVALANREGQAAGADACRAALSRLREEISAGYLDEPNLKLALSEIHAVVEKELVRPLAYSLRPVINPTGLILHTNLGRAPLGESAIDHIRETAATYSNLEFDIE